jgi:hypothetical protein
MKDGTNPLESPPKTYTTSFTLFSQISTSHLNNAIISPVQVQTQGERPRTKLVPRTLEHNSYQGKISLLHITPLHFNSMTLSDITFTLRQLRYIVLVD